jgi:hypothetical protein
MPSVNPTFPNDDKRGAKHALPTTATHLLSTPEAYDTYTIIILRKRKPNRVFSSYETPNKHMK